LSAERNRRKFCRGRDVRARFHDVRVGEAAVDTPQVRHPQRAESRSTLARMRDQLDLTEPRPLVTTNVFWRHAAQFATVGIFLIMFGALLDFARPVVLPIVSAAVFGTMLGPLARLATKRGIPPALFAVAAVGFFLLLLQAITVMVSAPLVDWIGKTPELVNAIKGKLQGLERGLAAFHSLQSLLGTGGSGLQIDLAGLVQPTVVFLSPTIGELLIFFTTLFFFLLDRDGLRKHMILLFKDQEDRLRVIRILNDLERNLSRYIGTVTVINLAIGVITAVGAWLLGFNTPVLFGALAFVCNYIPYIGPAIVTVALFAVGLISFPSLAYAAIAPALFVALTTFEGHIVTPNIVGRRLTLNPLGVFLSLAFWTWLWGPIGAFLSVPFLIFGLVIVRHLLVADDVELPD
jgi:predicted PurR-regulated permease PerM